ncbi:hypothetical protein JW721_05435 [Candidatus Micrarchaeota archaeon]|nr:hypothetical protein [Candidatus Micrarchaeota archaeon]
MVKSSKNAVENLAGRRINWESPTIEDRLLVAEAQEVADIFANPYAPGPR